MYIGGGTPSLLSIGDFRKTVFLVKDILTPDTEFTVEVNPEDIVLKGRKYVEGLVSLGVNRVSMGVQSFDDAVLRWMNRRHDGCTALKAYSILREAGVHNVSIDLIFGISGVDDGLWARTLDTALSLKPEHISAYQLSVEPGSALAGMVKAGKYKEASEAQCRGQYDMLCRRLAGAGYRHYEISNFAVPGFESRHNSAYWRHVPYAGFGPGAHSLRISGGQYIRSWNLPDVRKYIRHYGDEVAGGSPNPGRDSVSQSENLSAEQLALEHIMLGLRTDSGVERDFLERNADRKRLEIMLSEGLLVPSCVPGNIRIPEDRFFISDSIIADLV